jgi:allantoinase
MSDPADLVIRSRRTILPGGMRAAAVAVRNGEIANVLAYDEPCPAREEVDAGNLCLMPGLVDTHVHINQPGRTEWEGFLTATRAAAAGGITTLVDMPLNSTPATTTRPAFRAKLDAMRGLCHVDVALWAGLVPENADQTHLWRLLVDGAKGFKCFMVPSGVDDFPHVGWPEMLKAAKYLRLIGMPLLVHAEAPDPIMTAARTLSGRDPRRYATWLASRPPEAEVEAIRLVIELCAKTDTPVHIVHLSATEALPDLIAARARELPVTVETCPHYLTFAAEEIEDGATEFKCAPPIRDRANRERLWEALRDGDIDMVVSDHSPAPPAVKCKDSGDFMAAWGGIASLEVSLSATWTGARERGFTPVDIARWMSERPARLMREPYRKGGISELMHADLVIWDPEAEWTVRGDQLQHRHPLTPYEGRRLFGVVRATFLRGRRVFERDAAGRAHFSESPVGRWLNSIYVHVDPGPPSR